MVICSHFVSQEVATIQPSFESTNLCHFRPDIEILCYKHGIYSKIFSLTLPKLLLLLIFCILISSIFLPNLKNYKIRWTFKKSWSLVYCLSYKRKEALEEQNQETKTKNFYRIKYIFLKKLWPLLMGKVQLSLGYRAICKERVYFPRSSWYSFHQPHKDEKLSWPGIVMW